MFVILCFLRDYIQHRETNGNFCTSVGETGTTQEKPAADTSANSEGLTPDDVENLSSSTTATDGAEERTLLDKEPSPAKKKNPRTQHQMSIWLYLLASKTWGKEENPGNQRTLRLYLETKWLPLYINCHPVQGN
jgi:hypothetical protein